MGFFSKGMNEETFGCHFDENDIQRCPFLRNINKPTSFSFSPLNFPVLARGAKGPIFEDGPNFDMAFKLFHGRDGVVPLSGRSCLPGDKLETEPAPEFNPLALKAATISLSAFGAGGPFSSGFFSKNLKNQKKQSESSKKRKSSSQGGDSSKHEALGNVWLETGNCPVAKSYRAVSHILPLVATPFQPQPGMKRRCPPAVDAAMVDLAQTAHDKTLLVKLFHANMFVMGALAIAKNPSLGIWMECTRKFFLSSFAAVHNSVPLIAMLRKSVLMPKNAMVFAIACYILGLVSGFLVEQIRMKDKAEREKVAAQVANAGAKQFIFQFGVMSSQVLNVSRKE